MTQDPSWTPPRLSEQDERMGLTRNTVEGAWLAGREKENGSIEPGKQADVVVLDRNLFETAPEQIGDAQVLLTILDGEVIYERPRAGGAPRSAGFAHWR